MSASGSGDYEGYEDDYMLKFKVRDTLWALVPGLLAELHVCRECGVAVPDTLCLIQHLNDEHEWSREQIATCLDGLDSDLRVVAPASIAGE